MSTTLRLGEVILYVEQMDRAVRFYRDLLGLPVRYPEAEDYSGEYWVELDAGPCTLALHAGANRLVGEDAPKIVFCVDAVERVRAALVERGVALDEIRSPAPGVWVADGVDPEGNPFSIEQRG